LFSKQCWFARNWQVIFAGVWYNGKRQAERKAELYQRIVDALKETMRLMKEIDAAITKWPMV
jgi:hypothetical protein